jgi:exodeoxyribonuclease VII large subunit
MNRKPRSPSGGDLFTASPAPKQPANRPAFSVTELAHELKRATEQVTGQVWVKGEVMGLKEYGAGHWYFTLRDEESQLRCVMWRTYTQRLKVPPPEGTEVFLLATPTVWPQRGELRLTAVAILPTAGIGLQQLTFERTREQLERDGLLDPARKRALPAFPRMIAVVTSPDGVVLHDIVTVARRRWPATRIVLVPAKVQGEDAVDELVGALGIVNRLPGIDLCIVARGGGARDDLLAFNAEPVCRAVAAVTVPTVSAVGHETDITLTDLVADLRAPTPSAAAALALPDRAAVARDVGSLANRLAQGLARRTTLASERLARLGDRAVGSLRGKVLERRRQWERLGSALDALSPLAVMGRGYSIAQRLDGTVIKRRDQVGPGDQFTVRVPDGLIPARGE